MRTLFIVVGCVAGLAACGENLFGPDTVVNTSGAFDAVAFQLENEEGDTLDVIQEGGRFELILDQEGGEFQSRFQFRELNLPVSGTFSIQGDAIVFSDDPFADDDIATQRSFGYAEAEGAIFLDDPAMPFDMDNDGITEVAELRIRLEPRD